MEMGGKERRKFERIENVVSVKYKAHSKVFKDAESRNISGGGIRLALAEKLELGVILDLEITIPDDPRPFQAKGEVVWTEGVNITGDSVARYHDTGIKFIEIDPICLGRVFSYFHQQK